MNDENEEAFGAVCEAATASVTLPPFEPERHVAAFREAMDRAESEDKRPRLAAALASYAPAARR